MWLLPVLSNGGQSRPGCQWSYEMLRSSYKAFWSSNDKGGGILHTIFKIRPFFFCRNFTLSHRDVSSDTALIKAQPLTAVARRLLLTSSEIRVCRYKASSYRPPPRYLGKYLRI